MQYIILISIYIARFGSVWNWNPKLDPSGCYKSTFKYI